MTLQTYTTFIVQVNHAFLLQDSEKACYTPSQTKEIKGTPSSCPHLIYYESGCSESTRTP